MYPIAIVANTYRNTLKSIWVLVRESQTGINMWLLSSVRVETWAHLSFNEKESSITQHCWCSLIFHSVFFAWLKFKYNYFNFSNHIDYTIYICSLLTLDFGSRLLTSTDLWSPGHCISALKWVISWFGSWLTIPNRTSHLALAYRIPKISCYEESESDYHIRLIKTDMLLETRIVTSNLKPR